MPSKIKKKQNITGKSQKGQEVPNFTEPQARDYFERLRWANGPVCVHCGSVKITRLNGVVARAGTIQCNDCRQQFTVTVGTIMEDSHLPLATWARAFHYMCAGKKGISALQLQRQLGLGSYRTAWHLAHRIREAMRCEPVAGMLKGTVIADETYMGGKPRPGTGPRKHGRGTDRAPVMLLVERADGGKAVSRHIGKVDGNTLIGVMKEVVDPAAAIHTDEYKGYMHVGEHFTGGHATVNHGSGQYVGANGQHTNTAESFFALLKRGVVGSFHHVSNKHLHRYCTEFDFRWNGRELTDSSRRDAAVRGAEGKRLMYKAPNSDSQVV
jgi:transposase-like protein